MLPPFFVAVQLRQNLCEKSDPLGPLFFYLVSRRA
jgi:hypothetical protein